MPVIERHTILPGYDETIVADTLARYIFTNCAGQVSVEQKTYNGVWEKPLCNITLTANWDLTRSRLSAIRVLVTRASTTLDLIQIEMDARGSVYTPQSYREIWSGITEAPDANT